MGCVIRTCYRTAHEHTDYQWYQGGPRNGGEPTETVQGQSTLHLLQWLPAEPPYLTQRIWGNNVYHYKTYTDTTVLLQ